MYKGAPPTLNVGFDLDKKNKHNINHDMKLYAWLVVLASCHVNIFEWHLPWHLVKIEKNFFIIKIFVEPIALNVVDKLL